MSEPQFPLETVLIKVEGGSQLTYARVFRVAEELRGRGEHSGASLLEILARAVLDKEEEFTAFFDRGET